MHLDHSDLPSATFFAGRGVLSVGACSACCIPAPRGCAPAQRRRREQGRGEPARAAAPAARARSPRANTRCSPRTRCPIGREVISASRDVHEALRACTIGFAKLWLVPAAGSATALDAAPRSASSLARSGRDSGEIRPGPRSGTAPPPSPSPLPATARLWSLRGLDMCDPGPVSASGSPFAQQTHTLEPHRINPGTAHPAAEGQSRPPGAEGKNSESSTVLPRPGARH